MFRNFLVITALVYCTSMGANAASKIWDDGCNCYLPDKIKTVYPKERIEGEEAHRKFIEDSRKLQEDARKRKREYLEEYTTPEQRERMQSTYKSKDFDVVPYKSYCAGYAKVKIEQHNTQYYKDMYAFYDERISNTDMMQEPVNKEEFLQGYDMLDDNKTLGCVNAFDKARGFE